MLIDCLGSLPQFPDPDSLEVGVCEDPLSGHVIAFFEQLDTVDALDHAALTIYHTVLIVRPICFGEAADYLLWKQLRANISEEVDQRFGRHSDRAILLEMTEFDQILNLGLVEGQWHAGKDLPDSVQTNCDVLVLTILRTIVIDDLLSDGLDLLRRHKLMTRLDNHGENLTDLVLLMRVEVPQNVGIELKDKQIVAANES